MSDHPAPHPADKVTYSVLLAKQWQFRWHDVRAALHTPKLSGKIKAFTELYRHARVGRALSRYTYQRGRMAAGGIAFMALFSIAAAVTVAGTIFAHAFSSNPGFQTSVVQAVNKALPGVLSDKASGTEGLIDPSTLGPSGGNLWLGLIAFGVAAWSASRIVRYLIDGMRAMFGLLPYPGSVVKMYARYFLGLFLLILGLGAAALLTTLSASVGGWVETLLPALGKLHDALPFDLGAALVSVLVNFLVFVLFLRFVAAIRVARPSLLWGSLGFAVLSTILSSVSGLIMQASDDAVIAAAATVGTLLLWLNILARLGLMIAAWMADPPAVVAKVAPDQVHLNETPNYVTLADPKTLEWPFHPISGDLIPAVEVVPPHLAKEEVSNEDRSIAPDNPLAEDDQFGPAVAAWTTLWTPNALKEQQELHDAEVALQAKARL